MLGSAAGGEGFFPHQGHPRLHQGAGSVRIPSALGGTCYPHPPWPVTHSLTGSGEPHQKRDQHVADEFWVQGVLISFALYSFKKKQTTKKDLFIYFVYLKARVRRRERDLLSAALLPKWP